MTENAYCKKYQDTFLTNYQDFIQKNPSLKRQLKEDSDSSIVFSYKVAYVSLCCFPEEVNLKLSGEDFSSDSTMSNFE